MKLVTARTIKNQFPENIHIVASQDTTSKKWDVRVYYERDKEIRTLLLVSKPIFNHRGVAEEHARIVCESIVADITL